jgi:hypothetical protein
MLPCKKKRGSLRGQLLTKPYQTVAGNGLATLRREATASFVSGINVFQHTVGIGNKLKERFERAFSFIIPVAPNCASTLTTWSWFIRCFTANWTHSMEPAFSVARRIVLKGILIPWRILTCVMDEGFAQPVLGRAAENISERKDYGSISWN